MEVGLNESNTFQLAWKIQRGGREHYKIIAFGTIMHMEPFTHDAYRDTYTEDEHFKEVF